MTLRSETIQRWWPTTQSLDLVEGSVERVAAAMSEEVGRFLRGAAIATSWKSFGSLDAAFRVASKFTNVPTIYLVLPTHSRWSVLWNNSFLCDGYDSLCWCLTTNHGLTTIHWAAHDEWTTFQSGAMFTHRRLVGGEIAERRVQVAQTDTRWSFSARGEPLTEEDLETYMLRRKRDRLNEERIAALLARLGAFPWQERFYALSDTQAFVLRRKRPPSRIIRRSRAEVLRKGQRETRSVDEPTQGNTEQLSEAQSAILERIGDTGGLSPSCPLVSLELFFEGNNDPTSIGWNLPDSPEPRDFYELLKKLRDREDVHDVLIEVADVDDLVSGWPETDTIWFITTAQPTEVRSWFPQHLAPDDVILGFERSSKEIETYEVPDGHFAVGAWYD